MIQSRQVQQKVSHGTQKVPWLTLALGMFVVFFHLSGPQVFEFLVFDKAAILRGEIWRFFTGHFVHFGFDHFFWDFLAFIILGTFLERFNPWEMIKAFFVCCAAVSIWIISGFAEYDTYCGLSGALSGLLVFAVMVQYQKTKNKLLILVLIGTLAKIIFELLSHQTLFVHSVTPVPTVHAIGFISGFFCVHFKNGK